MAKYIEGLDELGRFTLGGVELPGLVSLDAARARRDRREELALEQRVIERWTGPVDE